MPAVDPLTLSSVTDRVVDTLSIDAINALLDRSSTLLTKDSSELRRLSKIHRESVAKVAADVAQCNARLMRLETILTRRRIEIVAERTHVQRLLETLEFQDRQKNRKLDYLKRRVNKMMNAADRDLATQQFYLKKCSLYELDDTMCDLRHAVAHEIETLATPAASSESIASSRASTRSRASTNVKQYATPEEKVINEAILSTWEVSRSLSHISGHASAPIDIKNGANDLLTMIERMATLLSSGIAEQATDRTQYTNALASISLESCADRDSIVEL